MFDCAIIGTSPIGLIEALHRQAAGQRVCLIDRESALGGAWVSGHQVGVSGVESYCHLITYDPDGNEALESLFPGGFYKVPYRPRNYVFSPDGQRLLTQFDDASLRAEMQDWPMAMRLTEARPISWLWEAVEWARRALGGQQHLYPVGGAGRLVARLAARLEKTNISVMLNNRVTAVRIPDRDKAEVHLSVMGSAGESRLVQARELVLTSRSWIPRIEVGDQHYAIGEQAKPRLYPHLIVRAQVGRDSPYSYAEFRHHPLVRRSQNQSEALRLAGVLPEDQEVHIIHLRDPDRASQVGLVIGRLQALGVLAREFRVMKVTQNLSRMNLIDAEALRQVRRLAGRQIMLMQTQTLAEAVGRYWPRWRGLAPGLSF